MKKPMIGSPMTPATIDTMMMTAVWLMLESDLDIMKTIMLIRRSKNVMKTEARNIMKYL